MQLSSPIAAGSHYNGLIASSFANPDSARAAHQFASGYSAITPSRSRGSESLLPASQRVQENSAPTVLRDARPARFSNLAAPKPLLSPSDEAQLFNAASLKGDELTAPQSQHRAHALKGRPIELDYQTPLQAQRSSVPLLYDFDIDEQGNAQPRPVLAGESASERTDLFARVSMIYARNQSMGLDDAAFAAQRQLSASS